MSKRPTADMDTDGSQVSRPEKSFIAEDELYDPAFKVIDSNSEGSEDNSLRWHTPNNSFNDEVRSKPEGKNTHAAARSLSRGHAESESDIPNSAGMPSPAHDSKPYIKSGAVDMISGDGRFEPAKNYDTVPNAKDKETMRDAKNKADPCRGKGCGRPKVAGDEHKCCEIDSAREPRPELPLYQCSVETVLDTGSETSSSTARDIKTNLEPSNGDKGPQFHTSKSDEEVGESRGEGEPKIYTSTKEDMITKRKTPYRPRHGCRGN